MKSNRRPIRQRPVVRSAEDRKRIAQLRRMASFSSGANDHWLIDPYRIDVAQCSVTTGSHGGIVYVLRLTLRQSQMTLEANGYESASQMCRELGLDLTKDGKITPNMEWI